MGIGNSENGLWSNGKCFQIQNSQRPWTPWSKKKECSWGTKIWLHWVTYGLEPWDKLCHNEYTQERNKQDLIHLIEETRGSHIQNSARKGRSLIHENYFWEVKNGESALFGKMHGTKSPVPQIPLRLLDFDKYVKTYKRKESATSSSPGITTMNLGNGPKEIVGDRLARMRS